MHATLPPGEDREAIEIAAESGVTDTVDPLAGSFYVESLTNEIQQIKVPFAGSAFNLNFDGQITAPIQPNATAAQVQAALEALNNVAPGDVSIACAHVYELSIDSPLLNRFSSLLCNAL